MIDQKRTPFLVPLSFHENLKSPSFIKPLQRIILKEDGFELLPPILKINLLHPDTMQFRRLSSPGEKSPEHEIRISRLLGIRVHRVRIRKENFAQQVETVG